jgi:putative endonuclease
MDKQTWVVYLVRCSDDSLYCGITNNLKNRVAAHNAGKGAKYTRSRRPVHLLSVSSKMTQSEALKLEHRVKHVPAGKKVKELAKGGDARTIDAQAKLEMQIMKKELKLISTKIEEMIQTLEKYERQYLPL